MRCTVENCGNTLHRNPLRVTFHRFPTNPQIQKVWADRLKLSAADVNCNKHVCSLHFRSENIKLRNICKSKTKAKYVHCLDPTALPIDLRGSYDEASSNALVTNNNPNISIVAVKPEIVSNADVNEVVENQQQESMNENVQGGLQESVKTEPDDKEVEIKSEPIFDNEPGTSTMEVEPQLAVANDSCDMEDEVEWIMMPLDEESDDNEPEIDKETEIKNQPVIDNEPEINNELQVEASTMEAEPQLAVVNDSCDMEDEVEWIMMPYDEDEVSEGTNVDSDSQLTCEDYKSSATDKSKDVEIAKLNAKIAMLEKKNMELKKSRNALGMQVRRRDAKITKLESQSSSRDKTPEKCKHCQLSFSLDSLTGVMRLMVERFLEKDNQEFYNSAFEDELKDFAIQLRYISPKAYRFLKSKLDDVLPNEFSVLRWMKVVDGKPAFADKALKSVKEYLGNLDRSDKT
ncbi:uncharacterized protein LOC129798864 isoform X5 [Phlebotomus papatasi]|uniref:uncharacterized protein LOC129798864 isoform X5 n=1 Tax=Phlebotomus papatasi TaxID=29031 RepID=UPI00248404E6|nr:uncharacterized protein LOC129798864 isoform X5 [Phlebotomus papatasi]